MGVTSIKNLFANASIGNIKNACALFYMTVTQFK
jgi:hypothetical protein